MMDTVYDVIIVGGGPAGLTAAIYSSRAGLNTLVLEKMALGGQTSLTYRIDNYPGFKDIAGAELADDFEKHVRDAGAKIVMQEATGLKLDGEIKSVDTPSGHYDAKSVILALGSERKKLGIPGENEFSGRGISYCATCDGNFFRNKDVAVIGGGNTAVGYALELSPICRNVTLIHHGKELKAMHSLKEQLQNRSNVKVIYNRSSKRILGSGTVKGLEVENTETGKAENISLDGVFIAIGMRPNSEIIKNSGLLLPNGFIDAKEDGTTKIPGVFAAGDLREKSLYQIVTAMADGANAAHSVQLYLQSHN